MSRRHHFDAQIAQRKLQANEIELLAEDISATARPIVVVFIDMTDSTLMKYQHTAQEWIATVYEFVKRCDLLSQQHGGTVIKHIGDEVMMTFADLHEVESFLEKMLSDETLVHYRFKTAVDYGDAYFMHSHHEDTNPTRFCLWPAPQDPYGKVVDRCARIAALAPSGSVLCSEEYQQALPHLQLPLAGMRALKGIVEPCRIYFRHPPRDIGTAGELHLAEPAAAPAHF